MNDADLTVILDVPEDYPQINPANHDKKILSYVRVSVHYVRGVTETRAGDYDARGAFPVGSFPFGEIDRIEVSGYGSQGTLVAYGRKEFRARIREAGLTVRIPFTLLLAFVPPLYANGGVLLTDPFNGLPLLGNDEVMTHSLIAKETALPFSDKGVMGISAIAFAPSGEYGAIAIGNREMARKAFEDGDTSSYEQWIAVFDTSSYSLGAPGRLVKVNSRLIERLAFSEDGNVLAFFTAPGTVGQQTGVQMGLIDVQTLLDRDTSNPPLQLDSVVGIPYIEQVRDVSIHDGEVVVLGHTGSFVWAGPTLEEARPASLTTMHDDVPNLYTACDFIAKGKPNPVTTRIARINYYLAEDGVRIKGQVTYSARPQKDELPFSMPSAFMTSFAWIPRLNRYMAVQPCKGGASYFFQVELKDDQAAILSKSYDLHGEIIAPFELAYSDGELYIAGMAQSEGNGSGQARLKVLGINIVGNVSTSVLSNLNYPSGSFVVPQGSGDITLTLSVPPQVAYPVDFTVSADKSRFLLLMREHYAAVGTGLNEAPSFYYTRSSLIMGAVSEEDPLRTILLYCKNGISGSGLDVCSDPFIAYSAIDPASGPSHGYPPSAVAFIYGVK